VLAQCVASSHSVLPVPTNDPAASYVVEKVFNDLDCKDTLLDISTFSATRNNYCLQSPDSSLLSYKLEFPNYIEYRDTACVNKARTTPLPLTCQEFGASSTKKAAAADKEDIDSYDYYTFGSTYSPPTNELSYQFSLLEYSIPHSPTPSKSPSGTASPTSLPTSNKPLGNLWIDIYIYVYMFVY
jgi:hypothetical protein